jgi:hypothetical protein
LRNTKCKNIKINPPPLRFQSKTRKKKSESESELDTNGMPLPEKILDFASAKASF